MEFLPDPTGLLAGHTQRSHGISGSRFKSPGVRVARYGLLPARFQFRSNHATPAITRLAATPMTLRAHNKRT